VLISYRYAYFFGHVKSVEKTGLIAGNIFQVFAIMSGISLLTLSGKRVKGSTDCLEVPYFKLSTIGSRAFPVAALDLELTTRHSCFGINTAVVPAPFENFYFSDPLFISTVIVVSQ